MNAVKWAIACLAFTASLFSQAPTNSLVAHFKLDGGLRDETGTITSGVSGGSDLRLGPIRKHGERNLFQRE